MVFTEFLGGGAADSSPGSPGSPIDCVVSAWVDGAEGCTQKCGGALDCMFTDLRC
jgi:hypothetical protein